MPIQTVISLLVKKNEQNLAELSMREVIKLVLTFATKRADFICCSSQ